MENFLTFLALGLLNYKVGDIENVRWHSTCQPLTAELHTEQVQKMLAISDNSPRSWFLSCTFPEVNKNILFFPSRHDYITTPLFFTNRFSRPDGMYPRKSIYWSPSPQCDLNEVNRECDVLWLVSIQRKRRHTDARLNSSTPTHVYRGRAMWERWNKASSQGK